MIVSLLRPHSGPHCRTIRTSLGGNMNDHAKMSISRFSLNDLFHRGERTALFIDGANIHGTSKALGFDIDYKRLREAFWCCGKMIRAYYYTAILENDEYSSVRPLADWLEYNGFCLKSKSAREYTDGFGRRKIKGNMDVELVVDALELAPHIDHAVLFSGDGDFRALVEALQRRAVRVTVVSSTLTQPSMISDELRRQADHFIELDLLREAIGRPPRDYTA